MSEGKHQRAIRRFRPYPAYRDSGVPWLGETPAHWEVKRLWHLTPSDRRIMYGIVLPGPNVADGVPIVKGGDVSPERLRADRLSRTAAELEAGYARSRLRGGDLVYAIRGSIGEVAVVPDELDGANLTQDAARVACTAATHGRWLLYALQSSAVFAQIEAGSIGATIRGVNIRDLKRASLPVPSRPEQEAIASFLDRETGRIDALVARQERLLALLGEKRTAIIAGAVARGLEPGVARRDSGVEWLGEIPAHWEVQKGRDLFRQLRLPPEDGDGIVTAFRDGQVTLRANRRTDGYTFAIHEHGYQHVRAGDLVINGMDAYAGAIGVSESTGKCTPEYLVLEPRRPELASSYVAACLRLMAQRDYIRVACPAVRERAPRFKIEQLKNVQLPVPPLAEQQRISAFVAAVDARLVRLIQAVTKVIDRLGGLRAALVTAAVTGEIDVRDEAAGSRRTPSNPDCPRQSPI